MVRRESVRPEKQEFVSKVASTIDKYPVVGIFDMHKMPASALQKIKFGVKDGAEIRSIKKSLLERAVDKSNKKMLKDCIQGQPGILFTQMNPFKLYKIIEKNKSAMAAKPGDIAPEDIEVKAGPTSLMPGPAITSLSKVGLQSKVEGGKISILRDKVVCKAGQEVSADLSSILNMLGIKPMKAGLNIVGIYENGLIYHKDVLSIDDVKLTQDIINAYWNSINLAVEIGFVTKATVEIMIGKAVRGAKALENEISAKQTKTEGGN